ncbi:MAG: MerR family transcriptional regulator [Lachnospiraceae bacterium]|nr:MerR family transcriptional regulator [Lachnospiraceae bacterium]
MEEVKFLMKEAAGLLDVEPHTLRYWEEELEWNFSRNELGHRYFTRDDIRVLTCVKELKKQGFQLKAIKLLLSEIKSDKDYDLQKVLKLKEVLFEDTKKEVKKVPADPNVVKFNEIMSQIMEQTLKEHDEEMIENVTAKVTEGVVKEVDYLLREREEKEEERYRMLDETMREIQKARQQVAATEVEVKEKEEKKGFFRKKKKNK